jgi:hypothetical protein
MKKINTVQEKNSEELKNLKQELINTKTELKQYDKLIEIYEQVKDGSYLNHLVKLEQQRRMEENSVEVEKENANVK